MITLQVIGEHCEQRDVAITEFVGLSEDFMQYAACMRVVPIKLTQKFENLVDCTFREDIIQEVPNEEFQRAPLFLLAGCTFRWIGLEGDKYRGRA